MRIRLSTTQLIFYAALWLTLFCNIAFFMNLTDLLMDQPGAVWKIVSIGLILLFCIVLLLLLIAIRPALKPILVFMFVISAVAAYFMDTFNVVIDRTMLLNAISTDTGEVSDLLSFRLLVYLVLLGLLPSLLLSRVELKPQSRIQALQSRLKLGIPSVIIIISLVLISSSFFASFIRDHKILRYYSNPLTPVYSAYKFGRQQFATGATELSIVGPEAHKPPTDIHRELIIFVVGETARADRFSLNGYTRETNPQLSREEVVSFKDVSSCGTSTAVSVPCEFSIYTREDFGESKAAASENVLDVLHHADVKMLWRDNNSTSKGVADRIPTEDFTDPERNPVCDIECRDEGMLSGLQAYVDSQQDGDLLIILHQMGSHGPAYYKRYPPEFRLYTPTCDTAALDECTEEEISNTYDNTILYTDYFLSEVIQFLKKNDSRFETAMMYVSDHGESLGEGGVFLHGLPYWVAPESQTHVPWIVWLGKNYHDTKLSDLGKLADEPLSHDNVFHTLLGLFEIQVGVYDSSKDLIFQSREYSGRRGESE